jgi:carbonic anhydrase
MPMLVAKRALARLEEGNARFVAHSRGNAADVSAQQRAGLVDGQEPFAIILGCSDSRVPAELVFDQGLGDLFVVRVAGNIAAQSQLGSIELAAERFGTRLVVVMGHSHCGAITTAVDCLLSGELPGSPNLRFIVEKIRPAVEPLFDTDLRHDRDRLIAAGVRANVHATVHQLRDGTPVLGALAAEAGLIVTAAEYDLRTGAVEFIDDLR